jgi:hypothetical protein
MAKITKLVAHFDNGAVEVIWEASNAPSDEMIQDLMEARRIVGPEAGTKQLAEALAKVAETRQETERRRDADGGSQPA